MSKFADYLDLGMDIILGVVVKWIVLVFLCPIWGPVWLTGYIARHVFKARFWYE